MPNSYRRIDEKFTGLIIEYVKENPVLYSPQLNKSNRELKEELWEQFAEKYNLTVSDCKVRWKTLRTGYFKNRTRLRQGKTTHRYEYAHLLGFLSELELEKRVPGKQSNKTNETSNNNMLKQMLKRKSPAKANSKVHPEGNTIAEVPERPIIILERRYPLDTNVVTADMIKQIIELREKKQNSTGNIPENQSVLQQQEKFSTEEIPAKIYTNAESSAQIKSNPIYFQVPNVNILNNSEECVYEPNMYVPTTLAPLTLDVSAEAGNKIINSLFRENAGLCDQYTYINKHDKVVTQKSPNSINKSNIETQYKETEKILKEKTDNLDQNLESSKESTVRYFDEMGEYVENRFPEDKQQELKLKIWSLIMKTDTAMLK